MIIDAHLDLAMNALRYERDQQLTVEAIRRWEHPGVDDGRGAATVSLPALRDAGVAVVTATILARCKPWVDPKRKPGRTDIDYPEPAMAHAYAHAELAYYRLFERRGAFRVIRTAADFDAHLASWRPDGPIGLILMLEGADPVSEPIEIGDWHAAGVRCLSLAHYGHSRYAAGTPSTNLDHPEPDAPLTDLGVELLRAMEPLNVALDLTHTADRSLAQALDLYGGPVCATHCNTRALCDAPRQLSDDQIKAIAGRGGVIGAVLYNGMIDPGYHRDPNRGRVRLTDLVRHVDHICQLTGSRDHVGLGSDLDGGFGVEHCPYDFDTYPDVLKLGEALRDSGFNDDEIDGFFAGNWARFWRGVLPSE